MTKSELIELLEELLGKPLPTMVLRQITKFANQGLTYKEIARATYYLFDVKKKDTDSIHTYGIGLVPYVKDEANKHYDHIKHQQERRQRQFLEQEEIEIRGVQPQKQIKVRKEEIDIDKL